MGAMESLDLERPFDKSIVIDAKRRIGTFWISAAAGLQTRQQGPGGLFLALRDDDLIESWLKLLHIHTEKPQFWIPGCHTGRPLWALHFTCAVVSRTKLVCPLQFNPAVLFDSSTVYNYICIPVP